MMHPQNIKFEWLYYFSVLAETRHFSEAARKLCMTQQALSKVIMQLENELKVRLIHRRPWELTEYGQIFLVKVKSFLNQLTLIEHFWLEHYREIKKRPLQIAIEPGLEALVSDICLNLQESLPDFNFHLQTQIKSPEVALLQDEIDVYIQHSSQFQNPSLTYETCFTSAMVLVAAPNFELSQSVNPLIEYTESIHCLPLLPDFISFQPTIQATLAVAIELAKSSMGVLWIPECLIQTELVRRDLKRLDMWSPSLDHVEYQFVYNNNFCFERPSLQALLTALRRCERHDSRKILKSQIEDFQHSEYVSLE